MYKLEIDHFAIACDELSQGIEYVEDLLGVTFGTFGKHPKMGTHNALLSLGSEIYLEVISIDPEAPKPSHARWFDLNNFTGPPRLTNWICRTKSMHSARQIAPSGIGEPMSFERGNYRWEMAVPEDGKLPFDGCYPALIQWHGASHPAPDLPDVGCRLVQATIGHPNATDLVSSLGSFTSVKEFRIQKSAVPNIELEIETPNGMRILR